MTFLFLAVFATAVTGQTSDRPPNVVIIYADDMGYGDVGCFGAKGIRTPNIDRMAREGRRFTNFHVAQAVCSASRTALLTGCYPNRLGIHGALGPRATHGIADGETTIAEVLKSRGYTTGMAGKWHLGHLPPFLPTRHGFDEYLGLPYSNDMWPHHPEKVNFPNLPLIEGDRVIDPDVTADDQPTLTRRYTERAVSFIDRNKARPFFFYLAYAMPHVPLFPGEAFRGHSAAGVYGDVIEEIDWSVGQVLDAIRQNGLDNNTLVIFTSDNGPWLNYGSHAGSAGPLREGKGTSWEGGIRVPCVMRWPGKIPAGASSDAMLMTIDLLPTVAALSHADLPSRPIDGKNVWPLIAGEPGAKNPHDVYLIYYADNQLQAVISGEGRWKLILPHTYRTLDGRPGGKDGAPVKYSQKQVTRPELYDLAHDVGETSDVAAKHPDVVQRLLDAAERGRDDLGDALTRHTGKGVREPGRVNAPAAERKP
jgi:arylsulfatase A-like enzyme